MKAVVLVGGEGTRLRPLTFSIPKPLLPVGEKPILQIIIEQLARAGVSEVLLATGYQAELIQAFCATLSHLGVRITTVREARPLGTAGPLSLMRGLLAGEDVFLLMNGDILTHLDFREFFEASGRSGCEMTVGYTKHIYRSPFGVLALRDGLVQGIVEKPAQEFAISGGIYALRTAVLRFVPDDEYFTVPDLMQRLWEAKLRVGAYYIDRLWMGLESVEHFQEAVKELGNAPPSEP